MIPKEINYIMYGLDKNYKPLQFDFNYSHYLNILSAKLINKDYKINLYHQCDIKPQWQDKLQKICNLIKIDNLKYDLKLSHKEHIGDLFRLETLYKNGGIYLDLDVVCINSFDTLLDKKCVMGLERGNNKLIGLCNAVIMTEPNSDFINAWLHEYKTKYKGEWSYNSVVFPYMLAQTGKYKVDIRPVDNFFKYSWDQGGRQSLFFKNSDLKDCYCLHLWDNKNRDILSKYNDTIIMSTNNTVCNIYKNVLKKAKETIGI